MKVFEAVIIVSHPSTFLTDLDSIISYLILRNLKSIAKYGWSFANLIEAMRGFLDEPFKPPCDLITDEKQKLLFSKLILSTGMVL